MRMTHITILGRDYPLCLSLTAYAELMEKYGGREGLGNALDNDDESVVAHTLEDVLAILMRAGRIYAGQIGEDVPPELPCRLGDLVDARDPNLIRAVYDTMSKDSTRTVEAVSKNADATPEQ